MACEAWSGDVIPLLGGAKFEWVPPSEEGVAIWSDNMMVPNTRRHKSNAEELMNFYYDPVNAAKLSAWNYYFCPVAWAPQEYIGQFDKQRSGTASSSSSTEKTWRTVTASWRSAPSGASYNSVQQSKVLTPPGTTVTVI